MRSKENSVSKTQRERERARERELTGSLELMIDGLAMPE
jgi:hypothetical protein